MTLWGFDTVGESAEDSGTSTTAAQLAAQIPAHPSEVDPLAAFVASLTPEQREVVEQLLRQQARD